jgi:hypothetical protein
MAQTFGFVSKTGVFAGAVTIRACFWLPKGLWKSGLFLTF